MEDIDVMNVPSSTLVAHVVVVGFHATLGNRIEFAYPRLRGSVVLRSPKITDSADISSGPASPGIYGFSLGRAPAGIAKGDWGVLPSEWAFLPFMALPDGSHARASDTVFFTLPPDVHCVACFRQIPAASARTVSAGTRVPTGVEQETASRGSIQKSVVLLCKRPVFGLVSARLHLAVRAYFEQGDFARTDVLASLYHSMNASLARPSLTNAPTLFHGLELRYLLRRLGPQLLAVIKLLLLERRVVIYSQPVYHASNAVAALVSLFPGAFDELSPNMPALDLTPADKALGFPLALFGPNHRCVFQPHAPLPLLTSLLGIATGCIIGTSHNVGVLLASAAAAAAAAARGSPPRLSLKDAPPRKTENGNGGGGKDGSSGGMQPQQEQQGSSQREAPGSRPDAPSGAAQTNPLPAVDALVNLTSGKVAVSGALEPLCRLTKAEQLFMKDLLAAAAAPAAGAFSYRRSDDYVRQRLRDYLARLFGTVASVRGVVGGPRGDTWSREMVEALDTSGAAEYGQKFVKAWLQTYNAASAARGWSRKTALPRPVPRPELVEPEETRAGPDFGLSAGGILSGLRDNILEVGRLAGVGAQGIGTFFKKMEVEMVRIEAAISAANKGHDTRRKKAGGALMIQGERKDKVDPGGRQARMSDGEFGTVEGARPSKSSPAMMQTGYLDAERQKKEESESFVSELSRKGGRGTPATSTLASEVRSNGHAEENDNMS